MNEDGASQEGDASDPQSVRRMHAAAVKILLEKRVTDCMDNFKRTGDSTGLLRDFATKDFTMIVSLPTGKQHELKLDQALYWLVTSVKDQHAEKALVDTQILSVNTKVEVKIGYAQVWLSMTGRDYDYGGGMREGVMVVSWKRDESSGQEEWVMYKMETLPATRPFS